MALTTTQLQQKQSRQKRLGAVGNFLTAPFKNIPNAIKEVGAGLSALRPVAADVRAQSRQVVQPSQGDITRNKLMGTPLSTPLGPPKPANLPTPPNPRLNSGAYGVAPASTTPTAPMTSTQAQQKVLSSSGASNGGFSSVLDPMDPAAIGGRMMQKPYDVAAGQAGAATNVPTPAQTQIKEDNKQSELERARQAYLQSLAPSEMSEDERAYQELIAQQARLSASEELGLNKIKDQPIALDFLTGQSAALQRNVAAQQNALYSQSLPLEQRIVQEQAQRQALQRQREAELGFLQSDMEAQNVTPIEVGGRLVNPRTGEVVYSPPAEAEKPMTLSPNQTVYDPATGRVLFTAPPAPTTGGFGDAPTVREINGASMQWNPATGQWEGIAGGAGGTASPETIEALQGKISMIDELLGSKGLAGSVGPYAISRFTPFSIDKAERQDFAAGVIQLVSQETLDALLNLKAKGGTLGALSDPERLMLQAAATRIGSFMQRDKNGNPTGKFEVSEDLFKKELEKIKSLASSALQRATGGWEGDDGMVSPDEMQQLRQAFPGMSDQQIRDSIGGGGFRQGGVPQNAQGKVLALGPITGIDGSPLWKQGLDIDLRKGQPVPTPEAGTVIFVGNNGGFGNQVKIRTAKGNEIWLSHLDGADVKVGQQVGRGQIIGKGGNSGKTIPGPNGDGSHLDLTIRRPDGTFIPPREIARTLALMEGIKVNA